MSQGDKGKVVPVSGGYPHLGPVFFHLRMWPPLQPGPPARSIASGMLVAAPIHGAVSTTFAVTARTPAQQ